MASVGGRRAARRAGHSPASTASTAGSVTAASSRRVDSRNTLDPRRSVSTFNAPATAEPHRDAESAAGQTEERRLEQELADDLTARRSDDAPEPDLAPPLDDGGEHRVRHREAGDQERHQTAAAG